MLEISLVNVKMVVRLVISVATMLLMVEMVAPVSVLFSVLF